jgi:RHS repeat-associated protein
MWKENYNPYGLRRVNAAGASTNQQWFGGKVADAESGLSYFGARYYDVSLGRFMGIDAHDFSEANLHSFDKYAFGNNNPYRFADPDGRDAREVFTWNGEKAPIVVIGESFGALAAYATGIATKDDALKSVAVDSMAENREANREALGLMLSLGRGGIKGEPTMLGAKGPRIFSRTIWKGEGGARLDVENPAPGVRPGQVHYQDKAGNKYIYDPATKTFKGAPNAVNKLLEDAKFKAAVDKGINKYLGGE